MLGSVRQRTWKRFSACVTELSKARSWRIVHFPKRVIEETTMIDTATTPMSLLKLAIPFSLLLLASASLYAGQSMSIPLSGGAEVPPVATSATGTVSIKVMPDRSVSGSVKISGFVPTVAHIHEAAAGKNGPPIVTLTQTAGNGFAVPAGTKLTEGQYESYKAGNLYVNVHSDRYPNGEVRAQLMAHPKTDAKSMNPDKDAKPMRPSY
jgi:hypothetical protein